jgi:hypothetical protein
MIVFEQKEMLQQAGLDVVVCARATNVCINETIYSKLVRQSWNNFILKLKLDLEPISLNIEYIY